MPIFDKLKAIFIVSENNEGNTANASNSSGQSTPEMKPGNGDLSSNPNVIGSSSEKFIELLSQVLEKNNQPGFDYLEYRKAVQSVAKLQSMDEPTQFKTAFAAAQAMNVQPNTLIDSAKKYLSILEVEETNFNQSANNYLSQQVASKEAESKQLVLLIEQKSAQLKSLENELSQHETRLIKIKMELEQSKSKVDTNKANFKQSYLTVVEQIRKDVEKMESYLK